MGPTSRTHSFSSLLLRFIICHNRFGYPFGQGLPVVFKYEALLVARVTDIAQFEIDTSGLRMAEHVEVAGAYRAVEASARLMSFILGRQCITHPIGQSLALLATWCVVKVHIRLLALATAVHVHEDGTLVRCLIFFI